LDKSGVSEGIALSPAFKGVADNVATQAFDNTIVMGQKI